ncbi:DNase I-like protein [Fomitiporia mediterranea MF3/22]|uniref:DNase I-like protein n=1 Tax=Fomitiporia mediterranea (strain MF3/22) TaxID=694068 RepID=UPI0004409341|nr:DNase I-like protein [Fomitiporia mediterranea MF3/22]EJD02382.1 DNase I-like protein [Fomitiporia mediterranea MF3/22]
MASDGKLLVQIATYNTNLQGNAGLPQDLVDWLAPTLKVSSFLSRGKQAPDIVAVGFQGLLPLHFGLAGLSKSVIGSRDALIRSQIEAYAPNKESYMLVARIVNVGTALLVYARDEQIGQRVRDVQTQWTGCGPGYMGNKGAVAVRFRLAAEKDGELGETFTFVAAHLTAHAGNLERRVQDYHHIVSTLLFPPNAESDSVAPSTLYDTSHLFFLGDLNFRFSFPPSHAFAGSLLSSHAQLVEALKDDVQREVLKEYDELFCERRKGRVFIGLREGEFWQFKCTFKYKLNTVDRYSEKRLPAWTDRVLYASYLDSPETLEKSNIEPLLYTSIPSYTTSDHKPVVALLLVPTQTFSSSSTPSSTTAHNIPRIALPATFTPQPDPYWIVKRYMGRTLDRIVGGLWTLFWLVGLGNVAFGMVNFLVGVLAWRWMGGTRGVSNGNNVGAGGEV